MVRTDQDVQGIVSDEINTDAVYSARTRQNRIADVRGIVRESIHTDLAD